MDTHGTERALIARRAGALARRPRLLCVSLHDVSPACTAVLPRMVELCRDAGVDKLSLLVVPEWHGDRPIEHDPELLDSVRRLADEGCEVVLHGFTHRGVGQRPPGLAAWLKATYFADGEAEFLTIDEEEASRRLAEGLSRFADARLPRPLGFVAPAWLASDGARRAIRTAGLRYHEDTLRLYDLERGRSYFSPVIGFGPRRAWEREALLAYARLMSALLFASPLLRVAIHPPDVLDRRTARGIRRLLDRQARRRETTTYREAVDRLAG